MAFKWEVDQFADVKVLRYQVPFWEKLSLQQKKLAYFLSEAGYSGRDIIYLQHHRFNLEIRLALEAIISSDEGEKSSSEFASLLEYAKRVFFSNGIHHHYGNQKFVPGFSREFFVARLAAASVSFFFFFYIYIYIYIYRLTRYYSRWQATARGGAPCHL